MTKRYILKESIEQSALEELCTVSGVDPLIAQLMSGRGIHTKSEAEKFLRPDFVGHMLDPFGLPDMEIAAKRLIQAIDQSEKVCVWGDYDADGIPASVLMREFFVQIGFCNFINHIPDRSKDGYGLNKNGITMLANAGVSLIITVDTGITGVEEVDMINSLGMEAIITDHHEQGAILPKALAVVNHKRKDSQYAESVLCGCGTAWKLIQAVLSLRRELLPIGQEKWLLDLVALSTISDIVPLQGENRVLTHYGLKVMARARRPAFGSVFRHLKINPDFLSEDDVAFSITPKINAVSKMGSPLTAFNFLASRDADEAIGHWREMEESGAERKVLMTGIVKEAKRIIKEKEAVGGPRPLIVVGNPEWKVSILGTAAASLIEHFMRPVFLWGKEGEEIRGSCRAPSGANLVEIMAGCSDIFHESGGHKQAGGFHVRNKSIHVLEERLCDSYRTDGAECTIKVDVEMTLTGGLRDVAKRVYQLAPFGRDNEKPVFLLRNIIPSSISKFGKNREHLAVMLGDGKVSAKAIAFFTSPDQYGSLLQEGMNTNMVANLELSYFGGREEVRFRIIDFVDDEWRSC